MLHTCLGFLLWISVIPHKCFTPSIFMPTEKYSVSYFFYVLLAYIPMTPNSTPRLIDSIEDNNKGHTRDILETYLVTPRYMELLLFPNVVLHFFWDRLCFLSADFLLVPPRLVSLSRKLYLSLFKS